MKLKKIVSGLLTSVVTLSYATEYMPETIYAEGEAASYSAEWVYSENSRSITNDTDSDISSENLPMTYIDLSSITDWSVDYNITATIQCTTETFGAFVCEHSTSYWDQGVDLCFGTTESTVSFDTAGRQLSWLSLVPWSLPANSTLTISNITIKPICRWKENNGVYTFTNHTDEWIGTEYQFDISSVTDWSEITMITADVKTTSYGLINQALGCLVAETMDRDYNINWWNDGPYLAFDKTTTDFVFLRTDVINVYSLKFVSYDSGIAPGTTVTVSNLTFHTENCCAECTENKWGITDDGTYCYTRYAENDPWINENDGSANIPLTPPEGLEWSDIQSISFDARAVRNGNVEIHGTKEDGSKYYQKIGVRNTDKTETYTRNFNGDVVSDVYIKIGYIHPASRVYLNNISFSTERPALTPIEPNDILIDDAQNDVYNWDVYTIIMPEALSKITTTGTLKFYTEHIDGEYHQFNIDLNDNALYEQGLDGWLGGYYTEVIEDGEIVEIRVDEKLLEKFKTSEVWINGQYFRYYKTVFSPDPDAPAPEKEEITPDETEKDNLDREFESNREQIKPEKDGPRKASDMERGKLYIQKGDYKNYKGNKAYAMRFVQKMKLADIDGVKNTTMVIKTDGKYIELSTDCYYKNVSIDGRELTCANDEIFIVFIIDNITEGKEVSFSEFRFNK